MEKKLDAVILKLASHYDMIIKWYPAMERHEVTKSEKNGDFFWTSDESVDNFLDELELFFENRGWVLASKCLYREGLK